MEGKAKHKFVIDRSQWRCGGGGRFSASCRGSGDSMLFTDAWSADGDRQFMCCLGFMSHQLGVPKEDMRDTELPNALDPDGVGPLLVDRAVKRELLDFCNEHSDDPVLGVGVLDFLTCDRDMPLAFQDYAYQINDEAGLSDERRERLLTKLCELFGYDIEFVGQYYYPAQEDL